MSKKVSRLNKTQPLYMQNDWLLATEYQRWIQLQRLDNMLKGDWLGLMGLVKYNKMRSRPATSMETARYLIPRGRCSGYTLMMNCFDPQSAGQAP